MTTKKSKIKEHIQYHEDGSVWAKGQTLDGVPVGYWEWFRKTEGSCARAHSRMGNKPASGQRMTRIGRSIRNPVMKPKSK